MTRRKGRVARIGDLTLRVYPSSGPAAGLWEYKQHRGCSDDSWAHTSWELFPTRWDAMARLGYDRWTERHQRRAERSVGQLSVRYLHR